MVPEFHSCLVCEGVREEVRGKLTLLGFFGICPDVDIHIARLDQPSVLVFLVAGGPGNGQFNASFEVLDSETNRILVSSAPGSLTAVPQSRTLAVITLPVVFGHAGQFALRFNLDGVPRFVGYFQVSQAPSAMFAQQAVAS